MRRGRQAGMFQGRGADEQRQPRDPRGRDHRIMRILVDADTEEFLGATILGLHGDDLIQIIGTAMQGGCVTQLSATPSDPPDDGGVHPLRAVIAETSGLTWALP